jgi:hypothetical protein
MKYTKLAPPHQRAASPHSPDRLFNSDMSIEIHWLRTEVARLARENKGRQMLAGRLEKEKRRLLEKTGGDQ